MKGLMKEFQDNLARKTLVAQLGGYIIFINIHVLMRFQTSKGEETEACLTKYAISERIK